MPPYQAEHEIVHEKDATKLKAPQAAPWKYELLYIRIMLFAYFHLAALYGLYICFTSAKWATVVLGYVLYVVGGIGVTAGAHRLWSHKAYKAKMPLQIILTVFHLTSGQFSVLNWVRDHRLHHKYSDTDADPHNASRGLFFSHIGWILVKKHPEVRKRGSGTDLRDIYDNPVLMFQHKYLIPLVTMVCFILPAVIPVLFWEESFVNAYHVNILRFVIVLNGSFSINSLAHYWGSKPYDKSIAPSQNLFVSILISGEGFHNYHHAFPWDYRAAELGNNWLNLSAKFIDFFAWVGWAYDLKTASVEVVRKTMERKGDGTTLWGWNDRTVDENCNKINQDHKLYGAKE